MTPSVTSKPYTPQRSETLSVPDHKGIGSKQNPGFRLPKDIGHVSHDLLAVHLEGVEESFGKPTEERGVEVTYLGKSAVRGVRRDGDGIMREVLHNGIDAFSGRLKMVPDQGRGIG